MLNYVSLILLSHANESLFMFSSFHCSSSDNFSQSRSHATNTIIFNYILYRYFLRYFIMNQVILATPKWLNFTIQFLKTLGNKSVHQEINIKFAHEGNYISVCLCVFLFSQNLPDLKKLFLYQQSQSKTLQPQSGTTCFCTLLPFPKMTYQTMDTGLGIQLSW